MVATRDFTKGRIPKQMIGFSIPILLGSSIDILYSMGDSIILGRLVGMGAFAAVGATSFYLWLILCLLYGNASGFSSVFGQRFGAGDRAGLNRAIATALVLSALLGTLLAAAGIALTPTALRLMDTPPALMADAELYVAIRLAALPVAFCGQTLSAVFYALGNSRLPFFANLISMGINLALDITLVLFTPLGVAAVAIGTVAAQLFTCCFYAAAARRLEGVKIRLRGANRRAAGELLKIGTPLAFRDFPSAVAALLIQTKINGLGLAYVAGVAAAKGLYSVAFALGEAFTGAVGAFVSQNLGARRFDRISAGMRFSRIAMLVFVAVTIAAMFPFRGGFLSLYIDGADPNAPQAIAAGLRQLRLILLLLPAHYIVILQRAALRGLGDGLAPLLSGFIEAFARVGCLALMPVFLGGEWSAYLAEVIGWPFMLVFLLIAHRRLNRRLAAKYAA